MTTVRPALVWAHRWIGLAIGGFLLMSGLTGSLLSWNEALDAALYPALRATAAAGTPRLDPLVLRERLQQQYPTLVFNAVDLRVREGKAALFNVSPAHSASHPAPTFDQIFVNPFTGEVQGTRMWGDISQGMKNLMPFIHSVHFSLALGSVGTAVLGVVGLLWTLQCFVGIALTFPPRSNKKPWTARWWPAWRLRWQGSSAYKRSFDLHRAGGLWAWLMLLVIAWGSVYLTLPAVFNRVMQTGLAHQQQIGRAAPSDKGIMMAWPQARDTGRALMQSEADSRGFQILEETKIAYDGSRGAYTYTVRSDRDVRDRTGQTTVTFDARSGQLLNVWLPTGAASGDTVRVWITAMHMSALGGWWYKVFDSVMGLAVCVLSATGALMWWKKRAARRRSGRTG